MARKRRGNGEGSIYQRANGTWCGTYAAGYDSQGRRRRRTVFAATRQEVQEKLRSRLAGPPTPPTPQRIRVGEYLDRWFHEKAVPRLKATTLANYARVIRKHLKPHVGGIPLAKLSVAHVQALYAELQHAGQSAESVRMAHAVLRRALHHAVLWRLIPNNVCADVERPRPERSEITPLTAAQVQQLLSAVVGHRLAPLVTLAVASGMRQGELFALQWPDVDFAGQYVMVRRTLCEVQGRLHLTEPKTARSVRRIDLPAFAVAILQRHRDAMAAAFPGCPWVFCNTRGGPLRRSHFHRSVFRPMLQRAGLPPTRFHDLRHTSATLLLAAGVHPKVVQERLGHAQIGVTLDTYSHVLPTLQREAAGKLDALLSG